MKKKSLIVAIILGTLVLAIPVIAMVNGSFSLQAEVNHKNNAINLSWNEPDNEEPYTYKVYQKKERNEQFQSISTANLKDKVKVLNIYPGNGSDITYTTWDGETRTIAKSGSLEKWMEEPNSKNDKGYSMGLIEVEPVLLADFNANPNKYMKDENGNWSYNTIMFGSWDNNGNGGSSGDITAKSRDVVASFIKSGRGVLFGHDTFHGSYHPNFASLRSYANIKLKDPDNLGDVNFIGSDDITIRRKGLLTKHPWNIGKIGTELKIPYAHSTAEIAMGDVWMNFIDLENGENPDWRGPVVSDPKTGKGTSNFYLTTWNNTAMIQTGHSNGDATPDEQKVLANTLFYLSQLTTDTAIKDHSGMDVEAPDKIQSISYDKKINTLNFETPKENGSKYKYYVEAQGQDTGQTKKSDTITITNTSGLAGYSYVVDDKKDTVPDKSVEETENSFKVDLSETKGKMLHVAAVDEAGNISDVNHQHLELLTLEGAVDHENNAIDLEWNEFPDKSQPYTYKAYQKKEGNDEFQSISMADMAEEVKVLNVHPLKSCSPPEEMISYTDANGNKVEILNTASLKKWMEKPASYINDSGKVTDVPHGFGKGLISVDLVNFHDYNEKPNKYLKDENGNYVYDVIAFGIANCNGGHGGVGLTEYSRDITGEFIESGRGVFLGHDTVYTDTNRIHTAELAKEYMNMTVNIPRKYRGNKVVIERDGLLTKHPWDIGGVGTELTIPVSHTSRQIPNSINDVWMKFTNGPSNIGNFYLTSYNNLAMSQTGHSTGSATPDEQKILANTMFYLSQLGDLHDTCKIYS